MPDRRQSLDASIGPAFTIEGDLGMRGVWRTFAARESVRQRDVVVNVLDIGDVPAGTGERFIAALERVTRFAELHVLTVAASGVTTEGVPFFITPRLAGEQLGSESVAWSLTAAQIVSVLRDMAHALTYAHERGVVHGDLGPSKVIVSRGTAIIPDFGVLSALRAADLGDFARPSPRYAAPEQLAGSGADERSDVYTWGVLAYEMLSRRHPFAGADGSGAHTTDVAPADIEPEVAALGDIPPAFASLVKRCLATAPSARPANGAALLDAFNEARRASATTIDTLRLDSPDGRRWLGATLAIVALIVAGVFWIVRVHTGEAREQTIVVVPFEFRGRPGVDYFAEGVADEITNRLTRVPAISVVARTSAARFTNTTKRPAEIGRELGAAYVLTGSVRWKRANNDSTIDGKQAIRIVPVLTRVDIDSVVWGGEPYEGTLSKLYQAEGELAEQVVATLHGRLNADARDAVWRRETVVPAARDQFLRGRILLRQPSLANLQQARAYFQHAIRADSLYARPWASYALAVAILPTFGDTSMTPHEANLDSERAARHAIALDSLIPEAWSALSAALVRNYQWHGAMRAADEAIRLESRWAPGYFRRRLPLSALGKERESMAAAQRAVLLDPLVAIYHAELGDSYLEAHQPDKAGEAYRRALVLDPRFMSAVRGLDELAFDRWMANGMKADSDFAQLARDSASVHARWLAVVRHPSRDPATLVGQVEAAAGPLGGTWRGRHVRAVSFDAPLARAELYAATGVADSAFVWLDRLREQRYPQLAHVLWSRMFDRIRSDARWAVFMREFRGDAPLSP